VGGVGAKSSDEVFHRAHMRLRGFGHASTSTTPPTFQENGVFAALGAFFFERV
jgi:hypothetical protein